MKVRVTLEVDHKNLGRLQYAIDQTAGFSRSLTIITDEADARAEAGEPAVTKSTTNKKADKPKANKKADKPKAEEPAPEKPKVEKPNIGPDEVRAAMLAYSKVNGTEGAIAILKDVGKAAKVKDVEPENYPQLLAAFATGDDIPF